MKTSDIPERPILEFLAKQDGWATWGAGAGIMPTVQDAMPPGVPRKLQLSKMKALLRRGLVSGCGCGCRGDWEITAAGLALVGHVYCYGCDRPVEAGKDHDCIPAPKATVKP